MSFPLPKNESERLKALELLKILDTNAEQEFDDLTRLAARICEVPISAVSLVDADRQWFKSKIGLEVDETPREVAFCAHTILGDELLIVPNAVEDERFAANPLVTGDLNVRFYAGVPLITPDGSALGSLCVIDKVPRELRLDQKEDLKSLARQVVKLLSLRQQTNELQLANENLGREIVERVKIEASLRLQDQAIAAVLEGILITEKRGSENVIIYANPSFERLTKYNLSEIEGRNCRFLQGCETNPATVAIIRAAMDEEKSCAVEILNYRKDGTTFWNALSITPLKNRHGQITHYVGVQQDITARKAAEEALKNSEERYRFLAESVPQQVWTALPDGKIDYVNYRTIEYYGQEAVEAVFHEEWRKALHPEDLSQCLKSWEHSLKTGEPYECEIRMRRFDGEYRWHLAKAVALLNDQGKITKWCGTHTDIHAQKTTEAAALESLEYRNLFQNANDAILIFHPETEVVVEVNDKACQMYGIKRDNFIGKSIKSMSQDVGRGEAYLQKLVDKGSYQSFETIQFHSDGTPIDLLINSSLVEYQGKQVILSINRDVSERKLAEQKLLHAALHDTLTGLPNRSLFLEHLSQSFENLTKRPDKSFAVLFLDLDHFKIVNDSLGHMEGDNLLKLIAQRLTELIRPGDVVARIGGDEFTILLREIDKPEDIDRIIKRIQEYLTKSFYLSRREIFTNVSIGIAMSSSSYARPEEMLRDADIAMYRAKDNGKAQSQIFNQAMREQASSRLQMETELRYAVERREFTVYYQPIINLRTNKVKGFEALVRWRHPTRGLVSPLEFIPIAEETGLIVPLGEWVLRESCRQLREWQSADSSLSNLTMSVNLSCKQFVQTNLVERIGSILAETDVKAYNLQLEVTESHLMQDNETSIAIMNDLRALGIKLSMDDFGTGYSSLSYLHRLPINYLKVDRSFVSQMQNKNENREIIRTIIMLAKNLNLKVIAEGIETVQQADYLKSLACEFGQGFLYSQPIDAQQAEMLLANDFSNTAAAKESNDSTVELINENTH